MECVGKYDLAKLMTNLEQNIYTGNRLLCQDSEATQSRDMRLTRQMSFLLASQCPGNGFSRILAPSLFMGPSTRLLINEQYHEYLLYRCHFGEISYSK